MDVQAGRASLMSGYGDLGDGGAEGGLVVDPYGSRHLDSHCVLKTLLLLSSGSCDPEDTML